MPTVHTEFAVHISDHLFDLNGNSFKVKGLEIREIFISDIPLHERPVDILLESADKTEPDGDILVGGQLEISFPRTGTIYLFQGLHN